MFLLKYDIGIIIDYTSAYIDKVRIDIDFAEILLYSDLGEFEHSFRHARKEKHPMKEKHISEIHNILDTLNENQILYILTFIKKLFGSN